MHRRQFLYVFGCVLAFRSALAQTQQQGKLPLICVLDGSDDERYRVATMGPFEEVLRERGWLNGTTLRLERKVVGTQTDLIPSMAADLVARAPDVLVSSSTLITAAFAERTTKIPIVFTAVFDPVQSGFSDNLSKPSRNITGFTVFDPGLGGKSLQLLKDLKSTIRRVTMISNSDAGPGRGRATQLFLERTKHFGRDLNIEFTLTEVRTTADIETTISSMGPEDGLSVAADQFLWANRHLIFDLTARYRIPAIYAWSSYVDEGGLMSYTIEVAPLWRGAAGYVDQLLRGTKLEELPIQLPTVFALHINLLTAKALDLTVPRELLVRATRVVE